MARSPNRIEVHELKLTLVWPVFEYLDRVLSLSGYGSSFTSAAEAAISKHLEFLIANGKIAELTEAERKAGPQAHLNISWEKPKGREGSSDNGEKG